MGYSQGSGNAGVLAAGLLFLLAAQIVSGATYTVGDAQGWDAAVNYDAWAKKYSFVVGDSLVFNYGPLHSVLEVSKSDFTSCSVTNPIAQYGTGSDSIKLTKPTQYFICGSLGHCSGGMALQINAALAAAAPSKSPVGAPPAKAPASSKAPSPSGAEAPTTTADAPPPALSSDAPSSEAAKPPSIDQVLPPAASDSPPAPSSSSNNSNNSNSATRSLPSAVLVASAAAAAAVVALLG